MRISPPAVVTLSALLCIVAACGPGGGGGETADDTGATSADAGVDAGNGAPLPADDTARTSENSEVGIAVLENDTDPDGDDLTIASVGMAAHGSTAVGDEEVTYQPDIRFDGTDTFTYTVVDPDGAEAQATVEVTVTGENDPPTAVDDVVSLLEGKTSPVDVLANDSDPEGDDLTLTIEDAPAIGTATVADGEISYQAPDGFNGRDSLVYAITDGEAPKQTATLYLGLFDKLEGDGPPVDLPRQHIQPDELAVVFNANDPESKSLAESYVAKRGIPTDNLISVELPKDKRVVTPDAFDPVIQSVTDSVDSSIQGYALAWLDPYRVGCMSITSAFALGGYDDKYCNTSGGSCSPTAAVPYFDAETTRPWSDENIRPTMMLAGREKSDVEALIDRGVSADDTFPDGTGYLVRTTDSARSSRWADMKRAATAWDGMMSDFEVIFRDNSDGSGSDLVADKMGVMFYLTGLTRVDKLDTNDYRPGAVGDHLTSFGGALSRFGGQMSAVEWLEAGLTGSYGTVVEPCNYQQKFPAPTKLIEHYFRGATLLEAYWKSVAWPGEGVFIGEPLASPWGRSFVRFEEGTLAIETTMLSPDKTYTLEGRTEPGADPEPVVETIEIDSPERTTVTVDDPKHALYKLRVK